MTALDTVSTRVHAVVDPLDTTACCCSARPMWAVQWQADQLHPVLLCGHHWSKHVGIVIPGAARCYPLTKIEDPFA